jgi:hypothetical protein
MGENQIVVYHPNETVRLDVRLENETVWLTQEQIACLFGTKRPAITKHLANICKSGELEREGACSILEHMGSDGKRVYVQCFIISTQFSLLDIASIVAMRRCFAFTKLESGTIRGIKKSAFTPTIGTKN